MSNMFGLLSKSSDPKNIQKISAATNKTKDRWFSKFRTIFNGTKLNEYEIETIEEILISADINLQIVDQVIDNLKLHKEKLESVDQHIEFLKTELISILDKASVNCERVLTDQNHFAVPILVVGVNGVGKTTTIAKLAHFFKSEGKNIILGAADTFRPAAVEQLTIWGNRIGIDVISQQEGADPGAVAFSTIQAAKGRKTDYAIIDTAGRLHTKNNLMQELQKILRVITKESKPVAPITFLVLDATTGQNGLAQAKTFTDVLNCDGIILTKLDTSSKGGIAITAAFELNLPVMFVGTGESIDDLIPFDPILFVNQLFEAPKV
ncbi:MAG: signal recognition particle-docking protein FtsY [Dehalococcoidia bacterium]